MHVDTRINKVTHFRSLFVNSREYYNVFIRVHELVTTCLSTTLYTRDICKSFPLLMKSVTIGLLLIDSNSSHLGQNLN